MKIIKKDLKNDEVSVKIESLDDLWYLSQIITPKCIVKGKTYRKISVSEKESERKQVYIELEAEKVEFQEFGDNLKVLGKIIHSSDDRVQKGEYHSFILSANDEITISKEWSSIDFEYINKSSKKDSNIMLVAADYGDAQIAYYHNYSMEYSATLSEELGGKKEIASFEKNKVDFVKTLLSTINELAKNRQSKSILVGATMSLIDSLKSKINDYDYLKNKVSFAKINYGSRNGIKELVNSGEAQKVLAMTQYYEQQLLVNSLLEFISKNKSSTYGYKKVKEAVDKGAVKEIILTTDFVKNAKIAGFYKELDNLLKISGDLGANISIINSDSEIGEQIDNLSGIAAILRYNLSD